MAFLIKQSEKRKVNKRGENMDAGLLFYFAHRTMFCQKQISDFISDFGVEISEVLVCTKEEKLNAFMSNLLYSHTVVFVVCDTENSRPLCSKHIFNTLGIPIKQSGEPKGILGLLGKTLTGYLIESHSQAIVLLPDKPNEIQLMLTLAFKRLGGKFKLKYVNCV